MIHLAVIAMLHTTYIIFLTSKLQHNSTAERRKIGNCTFHCKLLVFSSDVKHFLLVKIEHGFDFLCVLLMSY